MTAMSLKRPFATHYYSDVGAAQPSYSSYGAAKTEKGAIRAAVPRIFMGEYQKATVVDRETGLVIYTVVFGPKGLQINYGTTGFMTKFLHQPPIEERQTEGLRLVK